MEIHVSKQVLPVPFSTFQGDVLRARNRCSIGGWRRVDCPAESRGKDRSLPWDVILVRSGCNHLNARSPADVQLERCGVESCWVLTRGWGSWGRS